MAKMKEPKAKKVKFSLSAPDAKSVTVAGSFNNWNMTSHPLKSDRKGMWSAIIGLLPGEYQYKFIVDGVWILDPQAQKIVDQASGIENSLLIVK